MSDISYRPLIRGMTWSYSRLKAFESCKHYWFLKYIRGIRELSCFYTSYGSFIHDILDRYYSGKLTAAQMLPEFLLRFAERVKGRRPSDTVVSNYIRAGRDYLSSFKPFPLNTLWVEKKLLFDLNGHPFVCVVDYLGESDSGELYLVDHKSRDLKPRSRRRKPTAKDAELDDMLRQLYLYSAAVFDAIGKYPDYLCFNCFRTGVFIREPFDMGKYEETKRWALDLVEEIESEEEFEPTQSYFFCKWLCGVCDKCEYYIESQREGW